MRLLRTVAALALTAPFVSAISKITRTGRYLYDDKGDRFYIKGVAYQPQGELAASSESNDANGGFPEPSSYVDPLSSAANCTRDLPYLRQLGVNAVRVYSVNPHANHDECMAMFSEAGIYVLLDVALPLNGSIDRSSPAWTTSLQNEYLTTINQFNAYDNVLAYNIGNEVVSRDVNTHALPFVKAAARDVKAYLKQIKSSALVGYAATDGSDEFRTGVADYLTCGNQSEIVDLFGLNNYAWCGNSSYTASTWNNVVADFQTMTVPVYMSEFGCVANPPRYWNEVPTLYSTPMSDVFSGGLAFSYFSTNNGEGDYALVDISADGKTVTPNGDFERLSAQFNATDGPNSPKMSDATESELACPAESDSLLASTNLPPTPNNAVCDCVNGGALGCHAIAATASKPAVIGSLIDYTCSLLGQINSSVTCEASIGGNGTTGVYGPLSMCSPEIKLNWAMSAYWVATNRVETSCDFSGNATLNANVSQTSADITQVAENCLNNVPSVSTPSATDTPVTSPTGTTASPSSGTSSTTTKKPSANFASAVGVSAFDVVGAAVVAIFLGATIA